MTQHPLYPDRETVSITVRGNTMAGWFTGPAVIWTGGAEPKVVGPFRDVQAAMLWQSAHAQGSQIFPFYSREEYVINKAEQEGRL